MMGTLLAIEGLGPEARLLAIFTLSFVVAAPYVKAFVMQAAPGLPRLALVFPLLMYNLVAPAMFNSDDEVLQKAVVIFILSWLANFKLLALCLNRGALAAPWTTTQLAAILFQPIYPMPHRDRAKDASASGRLLDNAAVFVVIIYVLVNAQLTPLGQHAVQAIGLYCFVGILMDGPASVITHFIGFDIIPTFDEPWLSTSLSDFWGRRWNVTTSHVLRTLVYDPLAQGCLIKPDTGVKKRRSSETMRSLGLCCTFLVSGIAHELILWALQPNGAWGWKWFTFFTMQGPLVLLEVKVSRWATARGLVLNPFLARALTLGALMCMGHFLFFIPANVDTDTARRVIRASQLACNLRWR